jgi:hypothetical protein
MGRGAFGRTSTFWRRLPPRRRLSQERLVSSGSTVGLVLQFAAELPKLVSQFAQPRMNLFFCVTVVH